MRNGGGIDDARMGGGNDGDWRIGGGGGGGRYGKCWVGVGEKGRVAYEGGGESGTIVRMNGLGVEGMSGVEGTVSNGASKTFHIIPSIISPFLFYYIRSLIPSAPPTKQDYQPHSYYSIHSPYSQHIPHTPNTSSFPRHPHLPHPPSAAGNADYTN